MSERKFKILCLLILLLAAGLRFWKIDDRVGLFSDSARDILVAWEAVREGRIPLTGSFSSAGPFVFGPLYYWYLMLVYWLFPTWISAAWYGIAAMSVFFVWILMAAANNWQGKKLALTVGLLSAMSPAQVFRSVGLTQHSVVGVCVAIALWALVKYMKMGKRIHLLVMGLMVGVAISMHYQALSLSIIGLVIVITQWKKQRRILGDFFIYGTGVILPMLPLLVWDSGQNWANLRNLLDYIFIAQYRFYIARRWLTFAGDFIPRTWGEVIGGRLIAGWLGIMIFSLALLISWFKKKLSLISVYMLFVLIVQLTVLRYSRAELFEGYLIFLHPFILLLTGWGLTITYKQGSWHRLLGVFCLLVIIVVSGWSDLSILKRQQKTLMIRDLSSVVDKIEKYYPETNNFKIYDFDYKTSEITYGLSLILAMRGEISDTGKAVGVCGAFACQTSEFTRNIMKYQRGQHTYRILDISGLQDRGLMSSQWNDLTPPNVLSEVGFWWKKENLKSTFSLMSYIKERFWFR